MKRSRDSRYDKKRSRDKKDDRRKLKFSTKSTEKSEKDERSRTSNKDERRPRVPEKRTPKPETSTVPTTKVATNSTTSSPENTATIPERTVDYEVFSKTDSTYTKRTTHRKKKGGFPKIVLPLAVVGILFLFRILINIGDSSDDQFSNDPPVTYEPSYENTRVVTTPPTKKRKKINVAAFITGEEDRLKEITQLSEDSIVNIIPNVEVRLFKGFHMYETKDFSDTPIVASYSKYHFFYDVQPKVEDQTLSEQWSIFREKLAERSYNGYFMYDYPKKYKSDDFLIEETEFSISLKGNVIYGVATLIEYKNKRYFFQFISKERDDKDPNYAYLRKYLNYYLKINALYESLDTVDDLKS
ncbi:hypothetical protein [Kordia jejudonensis]|uniref:hypothetical protein n=1 Tax=Kordia jejudonensis TaxID=1348245 RepID=UPI000629A7B3|nr:hypothetical protein [Kordia jejudonensis]